MVRKNAAVSVTCEVCWLLAVAFETLRNSVVLTPSCTRDELSLCVSRFPPTQHTCVLFLLPSNPLQKSLASVLDARTFLYQTSTRRKQASLVVVYVDLYTLPTHFTRLFEQLREIGDRLQILTGI